MSLINLATFLPLLPLLSLPIYIASRSSRLHHGTNIVINGVILVIVLLLMKEVIASYILANHNLHTYLDPLNTLILFITALLNFFISIYAVNYLTFDVHHQKITKARIRIYYIMTNIFTFTMLLALTSGNFGIIWIAIEATTLASTFLVGFYNKHSSVEAAWKYVIICSVGIATAFLGVILLHLSSLQYLNADQYLCMQALTANAANLDNDTLRLAFIFMLIGFGTKAGLAPMHSWLPSAHSQSPSPISALLSGVLLNTALYPIIRITGILNTNAGGSQYTAPFLLILALLSILAAVYFILSQREYKSLLAYSSIEHMGIITLALAINTPLAIYGALFHLINHSLTKTMLFLTTGNILHTYQSGEIKNIRALLRVAPFTGWVFLFGLLAIAGTPPFSVFISEFTILSAVFESQNFILGGILAILLAVIFASIIYTITPIFYGAKDESQPISNFKSYSGNGVIALLLILICIMGIYTPPFLSRLLTLAQQVILP